MATTTILLHGIPTYVDKELILSVLKREKVILSEVKVKKTTASRFFSSLYLIEAQTSFYIKCLPEGHKSELTRSTLQLKNEIDFYQNILPAFTRFQQENCPQESQPPLCVPHFYAGQWNGINDVIILKDMCTSGFVLMDPVPSIKLPEITLAMKQLGRFHGFSLAMKMKAPDKFKKITEQLSEPMYVSPQFEEFYGKGISVGFEKVSSMLNDYYEEGNIYLAKYNNFIERAIDFIPSRIARDPSNEPYNVVTHGDLALNNLLFHYGEDGNVPDNICFLDFQQVRYGSPAIDFGKFLFVLIDKATRDKHEDYLLHCYHDALGETLRQFDLNYEYIFPFSELKSQLRKCSVFVVVLSIFTVLHCLGGNEEGLTGNETDDLMKSLRKLSSVVNADSYRKILELIEDFVDRGLMDIYFE